jgi:hypothetical protein
MIESKVIALLLANTAIAAIVGTRVYPVDLPQGAALPAISVLRISGSQLYAGDGPVGLDNARIQVECWAGTYTTSKALPSLVRVAADACTTLLLMEQVSERDMRDEKADGAEYPFHIGLDFDVWERTA